MAGGCTSKKAAKITLWIAVPIVILSVAMVFVFDAIYDKTLKHDITLAEGSLVSKLWEDIPLPIYEKLYFFNITNEDKFLQGTEPLNVTEVGPYTYKAKWVKTNPQWHPNNTVSYREVRTYQFVLDMSNGTEDDVIHTLNGPMIIASNIAKNIKNTFFRYTVSAALTAFFALNDETLITKKSIRNLVYEGYDDAIIKDAPYIQKDIPYKDGKFAWLYGKNATDDGLFTVFTGVDDASKTNFINNWNGQERLSFWKGNSVNETATCNKINGTSIETGPPIDGYQDTYTFFQSIFCRSLTFNYTEDTTYYDIPSKRFRLSYDLFANSTENPDNHCYEVNEEHPSGILDVSPCQFGAPVFMSFPHFHFADSSYLEFVNGMKPNDKEHGSFINVEPITGMSIDLAVRFQINVEVSKVPAILQFHEARDGIYPVFWVELSLQIDEHMADFLKSNVRKPKIIAYSVLSAVIGVSLLLIIISAMFLTLSKKNKHEDELLIHRNDKEFHTNDYDKKVHPGHISSQNPAMNISEEEKKITENSSSDSFAKDSSEIRKDVSHRLI